MLRAMNAAVSGLLAHEEMLDVIGNNIANVDTTGFKSSDVDFASVLSQTVQGATAPTSNSGGTNAAQIGLGVEVAGVSTDFTQGADEQTGVSTDLAIEGNGFFVGSMGGGQVYTRDGSLSFDGSGDLVNPEGAIMQGWMAGANGQINTNGPLTNLVIPTGQSIAPVATQNVVIGGNLPTSPAVNAQGTDTIDTSINVYNAQGTAIPTTFAFTYTQGANGAAGTWSAQAQDAQGNPIGSAQPLVFDPSGNLTSPTNYSITIGTQNININFASQGQALVNYGGSATVSAVSQDGAATGTLESVAVGNDGVITGTFTNGQSQTLGQVAVASFSNPSGLTNSGGSLYNATANSGTAQIGAAGSGGRGSISSGVLEGSNVDLSQAFSDLIVAQRGFEANSQVISTADQILGDLINMKSQ
jgi:flagellar hook protein FlgE